MKYRNLASKPPVAIRMKVSGWNATDKAICNIVDKEGRGYGTVIRLSPESTEMLISLQQFTPTKAAMLPQDWPAVNSYWYPKSMEPNQPELDWSTVEFLQFSLRDELYETSDLKNKGIIIEQVDLLF